jgi:hypothetical protein
LNFSALQNNTLKKEMKAVSTKIIVRWLSYKIHQKEQTMTRIDFMVGTEVIFIIGLSDFDSLIASILQKSTIPANSVVCKNEGNKRILSKKQLLSLEH